MSTNAKTFPAEYEICLSGELTERWTTWFDGLTVKAAADGTTVVGGIFADQAALHGTLQRVRDLGMPLVSVRRLDDQTPHQGAGRR